MSSDGILDLLVNDTGLVDELNLEMQEASAAQAGFTTAVESAARTNTDALDSYTAKMQQLRSVEDTAIADLESAIEAHKSLNNVSLGEKLKNSFASFGDPSKSRKAAASNLASAQRSLGLVEKKKARLGEDLSLTQALSSEQLRTAKANMSKELQDVVFKREQLSMSNSLRDDALRSLDKTVRVVDKPELVRMEASGRITQQMLVEELARREAGERARALMKNSAIQEDRNALEALRKDMLVSMDEYTAEEYYAIAADSGGKYVDDEIEGLWFSIDELQSVRQKRASARTYNSAASAAIAKSLATSSELITKMSHISGMDFSGAETPADAFEIMSQTSSFMSAESKNQATVVAYLEREVAAATTPTHRASVAQLLSEEAATLLDQIDADAKRRFANKKTHNALSQFLNEGQITDKAGASQLIAQGTLTQQSTGNAAYDRGLKLVSELSADINNVQFVDAAGWQREFNKRITENSSSIIGAMYGPGIQESAILASDGMQDPELSKSLLDSTSAFYSLTGKFNLGEVGDYLDKRDPTGKLKTQFVGVMQQHLSVIADRDYGKPGLSFEGNVYMKSLDSVLLDSNPRMHFLDQSNATIREQMILARKSSTDKALEWATTPGWKGVTDVFK